jgi:simple sugar transport system ATP-binding protein
MNELLKISNLSKKYRSEYALKDISLSLKKGEILGLVGANGSGKSTLMNILAGNPVIVHTGGFTGEIIFEGKSISPAKPSDSLRMGIGMVYQEFALIPSFTAAENVMLGRENRIHPFPLFKDLTLPVIDRKQDVRDAALILSEFGLTEEDSASVVTEFNVGSRQFIEFARAINLKKLKLLILDEPTAVLGRDESLNLMDEVKRIAGTGVSVIFISHRLEEVISLCDRIAVLRDGELAGIFSTDETSAEEIACSMLGSIGNAACKSHLNVQAGVADFFKIYNMNCSAGGERLDDFSMEAVKGEIVGITGQSGQGQMLIGKALMGLVPCSGEIIINGKSITPGDINRLFKTGFCYIPEERRRDGLLPEHTVAENITFTLISTKKQFTSRGGLLNFKKINKTARAYISELNIKCSGPHQKVCELSGGNQQKVILSRAMSLSPEIMMVFEPTRGIDVGAKEVILNMLLDMNRERKTTIIIVSSEIDELMRICDRIAVLYEGKVFSVLTPDLPAEDFALAFAGKEC